MKALKNYTISPFNTLFFLLVLATGLVYFNVYILKDYYPTFTTEEEIQSAKDAQFGFLATYL